ncbi:MAG: VWA domain-containing protein [Candidatus Sulfotelmatobacter sp.]
MHFGTTSFLRSGLRAVALVGIVCAIAYAQNTSPAQSSPSTQPPSAWDPDYGPPRTAVPSSVQAPSGQQPSDQQPAAQDQESPITSDKSADDSGRFVFRKQVQEVVLHATVVDEAGHLVTGLDRNAFSVYVNNVPEPLTSFRREDVPVALGIVIDNSGSMRDKREKVSQAVLNLVRASNPQDEVFVVNFNETPYLDQDYTSDVGLLQTALHQVSSRGSTALYDAVVASAEHLRDNPRLTKKVLLVITDGQDNMSQETLQSAVRKLQPNKGATIYAIGLSNGGMTRSGHEALQELATSTGGVAFFPRSLDEVDSITRAVAHDIRSQYTLAFKPGPTKAGYQAIRVEARGPGRARLTVRTRSGYYPGETVR